MTRTARPEVVDQNGQTTTVIDKAAAPNGTGYRPGGPLFQPVTRPFHITGQQVDLDLTPWTDQKIRVWATSEEIAARLR